jgi:glycosyltransferase involved in cell wall biosynthesis
MKILLINNGKGWGGGQEHLKDLSLELRNNGVEVHFLVRADTLSETRFKELDFPVARMPYRHGWSDLTALFRLASLMRSERFDVVSINREHDLLMTALAWRLAFPLGGSGSLMMSYHAATERKQLMLGSADAVVCISEYVRAKLLRANPAAVGKCDIIHNGIVLPPSPDGSKFTLDRPRRFFNGTGFPLIGMVGELYKNQEELLDVVPLLKQQFPSVKIAFIGDSSDQRLLAPLVAKSRRLGIEENVVFTGLVPRKKIADVFYDLDLSVSTFRNEGFGIVHLESLAAGTPVVAYNEGGCTDIFKGDSVGVMVDGGPQAFAAAVVELLKDHRQRFAMGAKGHELVKRKYSVQAMGETYLDFYRKLTGVS